MRTLPYEKEVMSFLEGAKLNLETFGELMPVVFIVDGAGKLHIQGLKGVTQENKRAVYAALWAEWLPKNPLCIITLNDSFAANCKTVAEAKLLAGNLEALYRAGDQRVTESISMTVYPRGEHAWAVSVDYDRRSGRVVFGETRTNRNEDGKKLGGGLGPEPWLREANATFDKTEKEYVQ